MNDLWTHTHPAELLPPVVYEHNTSDGGGRKGKTLNFSGKFYSQ
jgi:hypothetical protein